MEQNTNDMPGMFDKPLTRREMMRLGVYGATTLAAAGLPSLLGGCQQPVHFPVESLQGPALGGGPSAAYSIKGGGKADFFVFSGADGRTNRIAYARNGSGKPDDFVDLDSIPFSRCRHVVWIMDGFGYDVVKAHYDDGHLRMFHPPSRVLSTYPAMTDTALEDVFAMQPCRGFEAMYYDRKTQSQAGGTLDYLAGKNDPYSRRLHYRADRILDGLGYLHPEAIFHHETNDAKRVFDRRQTTEMRAYFVSSAGISTRGGAAGQRKALARMEQLTNQILYETRGQTKFTMTADHGHSYTPSTRIPLEDHLAKRGWKITGHLRGPKDVVYIRFGLETYAALGAQSARPLAEDLIACNGVELASYADGESVVVLASGAEPNTAAGEAVVRKKNGRYNYQILRGDPLVLQGLLPKLHADPEGYYDAEEMMAATMTHVYPAPLERLWRAHFALAENVPSVILSLADRYYSGSTTFAGEITVASTHGSLNYRNSTTFVMSSVGPLPPYMRSAQVPVHLSKLIGQDWPMKA